MMRSCTVTPPQWRVNGPLANVPEFYEAFGVHPGQPMWRPPELRVQPHVYKALNHFGRLPCWA